MTDTLTLEPEAKTKQDVVTHDHAVSALGDKLELSIVLEDIARIQEALTTATGWTNHAGAVCGGFRFKKIKELEKARLVRLAEQADSLSRNAKNLGENLRSYVK